jgi:MoxR-like ATPase
MWDSHGDAPAIDPYFVVDPYAMAMMATALDNGENYWGFGPGGSGKTTMPIQFCARTNRPCVKINFTRNTHVDDLIGGPGIKNGNSGWEDGVLIAAMKRPGTVIILDEPSLAPAGVLGLLQGIADEHRTYTLPTGEKVVAAPGVVFVVADNTAGNGDETGLYAGTNQVNGALVNRFAVMLKIDYLDIETEARAVHNHTLAPLPACTHLAEFVARARKLPSMENAILSIRNMCAFTRRVKLGFSVKEAADVTILSRMPSTERAMLETLFTLDWSADYEALMNGRAVAQPAPVQTYGDNGAFDDETTARLSR